MRRPLFLALAGCCCLAAGAGAMSIELRTTLVSTDAAGKGANGASSRPSLTPGGTMVAFDSAATNLVGNDANGAVRDVFVRDLTTGRSELVSEGPGGAAGDGPSETPVIAGRAAAVVFSSRATNLVGGDSNAARDVFVRTGGAPVVRVSVRSDAGQANGPSYEPDVSRDGKRIVFTSTSNNLADGDVNGVEDVFLHDLTTRQTRWISRGGQGRSRAPAISPDGRFVSFESTAANLVDGDDNRVPDVFLYDIEKDAIQRVSVSSTGEQQNRAVVPPFVTASDVSEGGRFVVWDSDATNLVRGDVNRDTDVFVRDVPGRQTRVVSRDSTGAAADNDAYFPTISDDGRYVSFSSFATNLWPGNPGGEDVFLHDRTLRTTSILTVTSRGRERRAEAKRQLLRRAPIADGGRQVAFTSTARLTATDFNGLEDVHVRSTEPPAGRIVSIEGRRYRLAADDPAAVFLCRIDRGPSFFCPASGRLPRLTKGRHRLTVRAGGPGMLFDRSAATERFTVR